MFKNAHKIWKLPMQQVQAIMPARAGSISRRIWSIIAMVGAIVVVLLYLVVPLMIFFGLVNDLVTQLLGTLLLLTVGEFFIFNILLNTARATKRDAAKAQTALINSQDRSNIPFDILVGAETEKASIPQLRDDDPDATEKAPVPRPRGDDIDATWKVPVPQLRDDDIADAETQRIERPGRPENRAV